MEFYKYLDAHFRRLQILQKKVRHITAGKRIKLVFGNGKLLFHELSLSSAEKTQSAGVAKSLTGDTLAESSKKSVKKLTSTILDIL
ncbi:hypothetical protein FNO01nite_34930 [Flavobacterium noncentrifugens]|nr:hypothetical protein FNO01nite_34930 [Flavobacterium noncentrifugens]